MTKNQITGLIKDGVFMLAGVAAAAFGLESFLLPNHFIDGGVTGISLLLVHLTGLRLSVLILLVNLPFLLLGRIVIGRRFAIKTALAITLLAITIYSVHFPEVTEDKLLVSVFGGFFLGCGIGLSMRGGSVLDGTEVLAIFLSRKVGAKVSDWVILINIVIFGFAAYLLSIEQALYSLLTYIVASKALDFVIDGVEEYTGVTIISGQSDVVRQALIEELGSGVTLYRGRGGYRADAAGQEIDIIYTVITRLEISKLTRIVEEIDGNAFITMSSINDTRGGMVRRKGVH
ncbi:YitT family protein [Neolewinella aurantiaca]|uniref:YitT family protein n=1 Tax=Neolewinella aurantiaca TaxID=2602767 RepID=A0A5C7FI43_9BACT|nr:YitT family protein [Neolewinella aurantiaca]TXF90815.1 YitT family protein [Neolewinella aurantiaca]